MSPRSSNPVARLGEQIENVLDLSQSEAGLLPLDLAETGTPALRHRAIVREREGAIGDGRACRSTCAGTSTAGDREGRQAPAGRARSAHLIDNAIAADSAGGTDSRRPCADEASGADRASGQRAAAMTPSRNAARALDGYKIAPDGKTAERRPGPRPAARPAIGRSARRQAQAAVRKGRRDDRRDHSPVGFRRDRELTGPRGDGAASARASPRGSAWAMWLRCQGGSARERPRWRARSSRRWGMRAKCRHPATPSSKPTSCGLRWSMPISSGSSGSKEAEEIGLDDYREGAALIAEWPEYAGGFAHEPGCLSITLEGADEGRKAIVQAGSDWLQRSP